MYRTGGVLSGGHQTQALILDKVHEYVQISEGRTAARRALEKSESGVQ